MSRGRKDLIKYNLLLPGLLCLALLLGACTQAQLSPQEEIKQTIARAVTAAENQDLAALEALIDVNYRDQNGFNKKQLSNLLRLNFLRNKNIFLLTKYGDIELLADNQALVELHVAMAGTAIGDASALSALRAKIYRFELRLTKQDEWLVQAASWQPASLTDMQ